MPHIPVATTLTLVALLSCACESDPPNAGRYELAWGADLPVGSELLMDGVKVATTTQDNRTTFELPPVKYLSGAALALRLATPCGPLDLPVVISSVTKPSLDSERRAREKKPAALLECEMSVNLPRWVRVLVDPAGKNLADVDLRVGQQPLQSQEQSLFTDHCKPEQRTVTLAGKPIGAIPDLVKGDLVISLAEEPCYRREIVRYSQGGLLPHHEDLFFLDTAVFDTQYGVHFFLQPKPDKIRGYGPSETVVIINPISCELARAGAEARPKTKKQAKTR